ncbi:hypothetical protein MNBD_GAMMA11-951 [hydrothermal vent metagenome]|uniref:Response regulatory domain-containing protein n=1 Tax=hydrothermal vent metagenome TaxID=652676 RepID=A0A3B0XG63_9ZZZZ
MTETTTIMIVDDSKVSRMMISAIIKNKHPEIELIEASNGEEAIKLSIENKISFFSVDLNMPGIDGIELISILKKDFPLVKYALLTANIQDAVKKKAKEVGAVCFNKPVSDDCINKMLEYFNV